MNEETPSPGVSVPPPNHLDWREQRREARLARRSERWQRRYGRHSGWIGGAVLILLGIVLLAQNMGIAFLENWWALLILIPAFGAYAVAWDTYRDSGRLTRRAAGSLVTGIFLTVLALVFLLNLALGMFWPVLLIAGGLALLAAAFFPV